MVPVFAAPQNAPGAAPTSAASDVALLGLVALVIVMPFEQLQPVLSLPGQHVTSVELTLLVAAAAWAGALLWSRSWPRWRTALTAPWLAVLGGLLLSSLFAPSHQNDALKAAARLASGFVIFLMAVNAVTGRRRMGLLMIAAVATGAGVAAIAVLEYQGVTTILGWLNQYRDGVRVVGGQVRSGATLQYPTIAAMYFEIILALGMGLLLFVWDRDTDQVRPGADGCDHVRPGADGCDQVRPGADRFGRVRPWPERGRRPDAHLAQIVVLLAALLLVAEGLSLTFTRAGLVGVAASFSAIAYWRATRRGLDGGVVLTIALTVAMLLLPLWSWSGEAVRLRFSSEGRQGWYRADFSAAKTLTMSTGEDTFIDVGVTNTGRVTWQPGADAPFRVSYHWLDRDSDRVVQYDGARTELPADVPPGASVALAMQVRAPGTPGRYRLAWDVVQEHRLWFSTEAGAELSSTSVDVVAGAAPARPLAVGRGPRVVPPQVVVLGRLTLWRAALGMFAAHPLLGVGPDNFRLTYGPFVGQARPDPRVHSNSMYFEWLAGAGLVGVAAFGWMLWRAERITRITRAWLSGSSASLYTGVAAAGVAVVVHGALDSFLTFTPTYVAITLTLGLSAAPSTWTEVPRAHRV